MKMRPSRSGRRPLFVENLERRELLAGNVAVSLTGGLLTITGNNAANHITVYQQANGRFNIAGLDGEHFTGPTTNLLVRSITANLQGGDDSIVIAAQPVEGGEELLPAQVIGAVTVNGGQGSDAITVSVIGRMIGTLPAPNLSVMIDGGYQTSGSQNDTVVILNTATSLLSVNTWGGADTVNLFNVLSLTTLINTDVGGDTVNVSESAALNASITLGTVAETGTTNAVNLENGLYGTLTVGGTGGIDNVAVASTVAALSLTISTYNGNDAIILTDVHTGLTQQDIQDLANLLIERFALDVSQLPFDYAALIARAPTILGSLNIFAGSGNDTVTMDAVTSTFIINVFLENGNDSLVATNVESHFANFNGGAGTDGQFTDVDAILSLLLFENVLPDPGQETT